MLRVNRSNSSPTTLADRRTPTRGLDYLRGLASFTALTCDDAEQRGRIVLLHDVGTPATHDFSGWSQPRKSPRPGYSPTQELSTA